MEPTAANAHIEALFVEHSHAVRDYLLGMCRNLHLAEELTSETFERALRNLAARPSDEPIASPQAWLRTIAKNLLTDYYRKAATRREVPTATSFEDGLDEPSVRAVDEDLFDDEALRAAHHVLATLTPSQRTVMVLRALHGYDTKETAALMGRSPQAVRSLRHKAMRHLADNQAEYRARIA